MATVLKFELPVAAPAVTLPDGVKRWWTAAELADAGLPGLSRAKRKINEKAREEGWAFRVASDGTPMARSRTGQRGGGLEYHLDVLPAATRAHLLKHAAGDVAPGRILPDAPSSVWQWFEGQTEKTKAEAKRRLAAVDMVARFEQSGMTRSSAVEAAAAESGCSRATLWNWLGLITGVPATEHLPQLAPRRAGGGKEADVDHSVWQMLLSDYLRPEKPTWESCYWRVKRHAEAAGLTIPHSRTLFRKLEREIDERVIVAKRQGMEALRGTVPPQMRSVADFHALELVNIDGHKWDVFVKWPDGRIIRPIMVAIQDVFSRKVLAWRFSDSENAVLTRLTFADLFAKFGIPKACLLDNGRAFASKWISGGAKTRFRFKIREEEPTGIMTALGIKIHWAKPYRGQSKPIERAFRDMCDSIAKHPAFAGAWTGNRPDAKPENYAEKAVDFADFERIVNAGIALHNAKPGRRTETAHGQSFDDVFNASFAVSDIGKASPEHLRMALLTADQVTCNRRDGSISLMGNRYFHHDLLPLAGSKVTIRFDPDNLHSEVHVYDREGRFLATAPVWEATGFLDAESARQRGKLEADLKKAVRAKVKAEDLLTAAELAALMATDTPETPVPEVSIMRPVRHRGQTAAALKSVPQSSPGATAAAAREAAMDRITSARLRLVPTD